MDIFISYSRADRERVAHIAEALEAEGYSVWWDRDIRAGEEFDHVIDHAIKQSKAIVVVWSKTSVTSNWVKEEAEDGVAANTLVPVMIDFVMIPRGFRRIQAAELHDAALDPTQSENWPEFLSSVRKQVGKGEGADKSRRPSDTGALAGGAQAGGAQAGGPSAPVAAPVEPIAAASQAESAPSWKRFVPLGAGALAVLVAGIFAFQFLGLGGRPAPPPPEDMTPVVLGIYPDEGFGVDQMHGLKAAFDDTPQIVVQDLAASLDAMKGRDAPEIIEGLKTFLETRNVIAIVGPSITEFTPEVLRVVEESGRRPAIILTTAASRQDIGWDSSELPLFRVGSGVDERADQFARLARNTIASGVELVLLYETVPNSSEMTYGQLFYQRITERLDDWQTWSDNNQVRSITYTRGRITDSFKRPRMRGLFDQNKMIIVVGLSSDYKDLVENFYRGEDRSRTAILGGWNTSKAVRDLSGEVNIQHTRLFDMTDVFRSPADVSGLPDSRRFQIVFESPLTPALRQEAVAYDSGLVIKQAVSQMGEEVTAEQLVEIMRGQSFNGITGEITFTGTGENWGQNSGTAGGMQPLYNLRYNPDEANWTEIESFDALLRTSVASN